MPPISEYSTWSERESDVLNELEPVRKYIFICEGSKTEVLYLKALFKRRKQLGLHPLVDMRLWEKTGNDEGISNPQALLRFAQREKDSNRLLFNPLNDRMVIVFDLDIYSRVGAGRTGSKDKSAEFDAIRKSAEKNNDILAVTNPSFELFLLLHSENAYTNFVCPHETEILENQKTGKQRFVQRLFSDIYNMNPKRSSKVGQLAEMVDTAIREELFLNQNLDKALTTLTCNIGSIINFIRNDQIEDIQI